MYTLILISKLTPRTQIFGTYSTYQEAWDHLQEILEKKIPILTGEDAIRVEANRREKLRERVRSEERFSYSRGYALETSDAIHAEVMTYHHPEEGSAQPVDGEHDTEDTDVED